MLVYHVLSDHDTLEEMQEEVFTPTLKDVSAMCVKISIEKNSPIQIKNRQAPNWKEAVVPIFTEENIKIALAQANDTTPDNISIKIHLIRKGQTTRSEETPKSLRHQ